MDFYSKRLLTLIYWILRKPEAASHTEKRKPEELQKDSLLLEATRDRAKTHRLLPTKMLMQGRRIFEGFSQAEEGV